MSEARYVEEHGAIVAVLRNYIEGNAMAGSVLVKPAFHPQATIFGQNGQEVFGPEVQKLYDVVDALPPYPGARAAIARIDIAGTAASARVDSDNVAGNRYTDFLNLLKVDGTWVIVSKIYYAHLSGARDVH